MKPVDPDTKVTVGIIGINGGYGQFLKQKFEEEGHTVIGTDRPKPKYEEVIAGADVVIFCTPTPVTPGLMQELKKFGRKDQLWSDLTSVKEAVVAAMADAKPDYISVHPLASPDMIHVQRCIFITERPGRWEKWYRDCWAKLTIGSLTKSASRHDELMAPNQGALSALTTSMVLALPKGKSEKEIVRSSTLVSRLFWPMAARILAANPYLRAELMIENNSHVVPYLEKVQEQLGDIIEAAKEKDYHTLVAIVAEARDRFGDDLKPLAETAKQLAADLKSSE